MRITSHCRGRQPRRGVILLVVIALLTLFAIVGISFSFFAETAKRGNRQFRDDALDLARQTFDLADGLAPDLVRSEHEEVDFRPHLARIDSLADRADCLKTKVEEARDREPDPESRRNLDSLARKIEMYGAGLEQLRGLVEQIQLAE